MFKGEGSARPSRGGVATNGRDQTQFLLTLINFIRLIILMNSGQRDRLKVKKKDVPVSGTAHFAFKTMYRPSLDNKIFKKLHRPYMFSTSLIAYIL